MTIRSLVGANRPLDNGKLVDEPNADSRRALRSVTANMSAPTGDAGFPSHGRAKLHVVVKIKDPAVTCDCEVHVRHEMTGEWTLVEESAPGIPFETDGTWSLPAGENVSRFRVLEIAGAERVAVRLVNFAGTVVNGVDAWLGVVGGFSPADK